MNMTKCRGCGEYIVFLKTINGSKIPVDVDSIEDETDEIFNPKIHISHFATCPKADRFRSRKKS